MPLFSEKGSATILEPVPFAEWQQRPAWPAVSLSNTDPVEDLAPHVGRLRLIVLNFPKFSDGRAYSQARLLRGRLGYAGEMRCGPQAACCRTSCRSCCAAVSTLLTATRRALARLWPRPARFLAWFTSPPRTTGRPLRYCD